MLPICYANYSPPADLVVYNKEKYEFWNEKKSAYQLTGDNRHYHPRCQCLKTVDSIPMKDLVISSRITITKAHIQHTLRDGFDIQKVISQILPY